MPDIALGAAPPRKAVLGSSNRFHLARLCSKPGNRAGSAPVLGFLYYFSTIFAFYPPNPPIYLLE
jgi:hypothetical protein